MCSHFVNEQATWSNVFLFSQIRMPTLKEGNPPTLRQLFYRAKPSAHLAILACAFSFICLVEKSENYP